MVKLRILSPAGEGYDTVIAAGGLPDRVIAARCTEEDRVLLTPRSTGPVFSAPLIRQFKLQYETMPAADLSLISRIPAGVRGAHANRLCASQAPTSNLISCNQSEPSGAFSTARQVMA